ncbi:hypothetical protein Forpi1262_v009559 [Fusarium oxysporum f. sp. raphani]|uniref:Secreted in xylem 7 n=1 Tax=Fusarium oxysporum f. sp. raphani TaxID=96318 RepID=A0A8J5ULR1_FUSOX|nr:hypothetical protein Forpi1262_v009559 [Fusarium oxysporum f. sp. raphani]KAI8404580.1 hypothetical protein FOFC_16075 [Fusarium oxysporum]KAI8404606.1 hypothetical protein FOFC_16101 [Fusarium oxysporum]
MFFIKPIFVAFSFYIALITAKPLPEKSESTALAIEARGDPNGICFLRSMQTTFNRFRGGIEVDITQALDNIRGDDPGRLPWNTMAGSPTLSWRAWRSQVVGSNGQRYWRGHVQIRNSGSRAQSLTIEQPETATTRYIRVEVEAENLVTQEPSMTCTMVDNIREGTYIIRDI